MDIFAYLIPIGLGVVFLTLCFGIYTLFRGGDFSRSWSNKAMRFRVVAVPPDVFQRWIQQHQQPVGPAITPGSTDPAQIGPGDPLRGEKAFLNVKNLCITCHRVEGYKEAVGVTGPNLTYFGSRLTIGAGARLTAVSPAQSVTVTWTSLPIGAAYVNTARPWARSSGCTLGGVISATRRRTCAAVGRWSISGSALPPTSSVGAPPPPMDKLEPLRANSD